MTDTVLEIAAPECAVEDFDGEIVVLNMDSGVYFSIREPAASLWRDLAQGHSVEALIEHAAAGGNAVDLVKAFIADVQQQGLLRAAKSPAHISDSPTFSASALLVANGPLLESFDDMQQLLLLDPVHEVSEGAGWPKQADE